MRNVGGSSSVRVKPVLIIILPLRGGFSVESFLEISRPIPWLASLISTIVLEEAIVLVVAPVAVDDY